MVKQKNATTLSSCFGSCYSALLWVLKRANFADSLREFLYFNISWILFLGFVIKRVTFTGYCLGVADVVINQHVAVKQHDFPTYP